MKNSYLGQAWLVLAISLVFGALLAGVQVGLAAKIAANKLNETLDQIPNLVPGGVADKSEEVQMGDRAAFKVMDADGKHIGWVIKAAGNGFADRIELLIGMDAEAKMITGLYVLDQKETPALGDNIKKADFRDRFNGKPTDVALSASQTPTGPDQIQAISGATISSQSVCDIVNGATDQFVAALAGGEE
jgi:electron transport complex protein RnfG